MAKEYYSLSSGYRSLAARLLYPIIVFTCIFQAHPPEIQAQTLKFSLDTFSELHQEATWDTMHVGDIHYLKIGPYHRVPNFLPYDFERDRVIKEYVDEGKFQITFRVPRTHTFAHEEEKQGAFWYIKPRNFDIPGLGIEIESIDAIAERRRKSSLYDVWRTTLVQSFTGKKVEQRERKGLIHVDIPLPLGPLERVLGRGDQTNIDVSGRESITFSGESRRVDPFIGVEGQKKQPLFPSLEMKQELDIRLKGQVGEKVNVQVDHTSQEFSSNQNRIRLNYVGFDDDIVQLIELGNTSLTLPGGQAGGISTASKGLFGIKMLAQMGPVDVTAIASKQEGEVSSASFTPTGGAIGQTEERTIHDISYVGNTYFYLDNPSKGPFIQPKVGELEVFLSVTDIERQNINTITYFGLAFKDTTARGTPIRDAKAEFEAGLETPPREEGYFKELFFGDDYRYVLSIEDESVLGIELLQSVQDSRVLAVRYVNTAGDTIGDYQKFPTVPEGGNPEEYPIFLEVIKPRNPRPLPSQFGYTWDFMMRNIYSLGLTNIDATTLEIEIQDVSNNDIPTQPPGETVPYLRIFGLDQYDDSGQKGPDNRIDLQAGLIDFNRGLLTFPDLRPFDPPDSLVGEWTASDKSFTLTDYDSLNLANPDIYDKYLTGLDLQKANRYDLVVRASSTTRSFRIDALNITEGSEVITLDGRRLSRDTDYTIDYQTGEVELKGDVVNELTPSSQINIDYEYTPFAGGASSSLVGFNALWNISQQSRFGTTWLYESKSTGTLKPRLGEEPTRAVVGDLYGNFQFELNQLTSLVNLLPLVDSDVPSTVTLGGGIAASFPDPNTKGEVYIDDMEGVEDSDIISLGRRNWWWASPPIDPDGNGATALPADLRERFFWYNIEPNYGVHRRDLNPELNERESNLVTSLDLEFDTVPDDPNAWGGLMTGFAGGGLDISKGQFIELWVNDFKPDPNDRGGVIYIEMGAIDEDFFEPDLNKENNEDKNKDGFTALTEDTGLDGVFDKDGDTSDDDYSVERDDDGRFTHINGTEGNYLLDSEDLDRSGVMEQNDSYFRYELHLDSIAEVDIRRDYPNYDGFRVSGHENDAWRLYRIKLDESEIADKTGGKPLLNQITHMRIWMRDVSHTLRPDLRRLQIAELKIVGNRWEKDGFRRLDGTLVADSSFSDFTLGVINTKTEPIKYKPPILPAQQNEIYEKEQSLLLNYTNLEPERAFRIQKQYPGTGQDYTNYRDLNFWVYTDMLDDSLEYYFQIAYNDTNYYEIAVPLTAEYFGATGWMLAQVDLNDLTGLKFLTPDNIVSGKAPDLTVPGRSYTVRMRGKPDLFKVRYLFAGLRNLRYRSTSADSLQEISVGSVSGEMWLDDIYLGSVKRDIDFTSSVTAGINIGNVIRLNANYRRTGPDYRGLQQRRGSGSLNQSYGLSGKTDVEKFIPLFGFRIPVSGNYGRSTIYPKFSPNSDTEIEDKALQDSLRTESTNRGFSTTLTRKGSKNPFLKYTFDKLTANFSMSQTRLRSPFRTDTTTRMNGTLDYQMSWSGDHDIRLFKSYKLRYWLNSLSYRVSASRTKGKSYKLFEDQFVLDRRTWAGTMQQSGSASYVPFRSLTASFKMNLNRDLRQPHKFAGVDIGTEINRNHNLQMSYKPPPVWILKSLSPDFNYAAGYHEDSSPNVRRRGDPVGVRNVSSTRTINTKARFGLGDFFKKVFRKIHLAEKPKKAVQPPAPKEQPPAPAGADTTAVGEKGTAEVGPEQEAKPASRRDPLLPLRKLGGILGNIRKIEASVQQRTSSRYTRIPGRPTLDYQLGLTKRSSVTRDGVTYNNPEEYTRSINFNLNSGVEITENIDVAGRFSRNYSTREFRDTEYKTRSGNWPDINVSWKGLEKFGLFRSVISSASANFSFQKNWTESGKKEAVDTRTENLTITPTLSTSWKNGINSNASVLITRQITDSRGSKNESSQFSVTLDIKKSFTGGEKGFRVPLPFMSKRIKFKSRLDSSLGITYSRRGGKRYLPGSDQFDELPLNTVLKVSPRFTYNFSSSLNGSFFADYTRTYSDATNQTTTAVRVGITTIFTF